MFLGWEAKRTVLLWHAVYAYLARYCSDTDGLCGLVVIVPEVSGSIPGTTRFFWEVVGLERGPLSLVYNWEATWKKK
jgi:hypothetical protein